MRDVKERRAQTVAMQGYEGISGYYAGKGFSYPINSSYFTSREGRADIRQSDGVTPTAYNAYRITSRAIGFRATKFVEKSNGSYRNFQEGKRSFPEAVYRPGLGVGPNFYPNVQNSIRIECRTRVLNKLSESKIDLGETIGSIHQTAKLVNNTLLNLVTAFRAILRGQFRVALRALGVRNGKFGKRGSRLNIASDWLALQFGWMPLMNDIYNGVDEIKRLANEDLDMIKVKHTLVKPYDPNSLFSAYSYSGVGIIQGCQIGLNYAVDHRPLRALNTLNLANPLNVAWQLYPMSFVIDWFLAVGSFLQALTAGYGLTFTGGYETTFVKGSATVYYDALASTYPDGSLPGASTNVFSMRRVVLQDPPRPGLYIPSGLNFRSTLESTKYLYTLLALGSVKGRL